MRIIPPINFKTWINENSITEVECLVPDLGGIARGKILPSNKFLEGMENVDKIKKGDENNNGSVSDPDKIISFKSL